MPYKNGSVATLEANKNIESAEIFLTTKLSGCTVAVPEDSTSLEGAMHLNLKRASNTAAEDQKISQLFERLEAGETLDNEETQEFNRLTSEVDPAKMAEEVEKTAANKSKNYLMYQSTRAEKNQNFVGYRKNTEVSWEYRLNEGVSPKVVEAAERTTEGTTVKQIEKLAINIAEEV